MNSLGTISVIPATISPEIVQEITSSFAWEYKIVPISVSSSSIEFLSEASTQTLKDELEVLLGKSVELTVVSTEDLNPLLNRYYRRNKEGEHNVSLSNPDSFLDDLIAEAKHLGSSDIHVEAYEKSCRVRYRIDGHLIEKYSIPMDLYPSIVNKIKIKANLDIGEKRLPQDGRIIFQHQSVSIDIRTSILPTLFGEKIVMRLLNNDASNLSVDQIGMEPVEKKHYLDGVRKPSGIILISGPTGSGKTTTLYATLKMLNQEKTNVVTVEDPIEYTLPGINQVQVKEAIGLTFSSALRSFLRQDPDIIMLGEIRDVETANMAVRASLTGHLVLSTIHTNSAWGTISRLIDMGIPSFLLANSISVSIAQRLLRKLCTGCKEQKKVTRNEIPGDWLKEDHVEVSYPVGCEACHYTGYNGRKAIYEVIPITDSIREFIKSNKGDIKGELRKNSIKSLSERAFEMLIHGETSLEETYPYLLS
ncbi:MAG: type II/IV secretion system protein [Flavobacteriales bacterium]|nr:type II/IV secretion system protein [Flavobacteriales bacterium]